MPEYPLEKMHKYFFDWFEEKRKNDGFFYSVRKQNGDRLRNGYLFLGNDYYIGVPFVNHRDWRHKTASIQFVYGNKKADDFCIEFVSRNLEGENLNSEEIDLAERDFYEKMRDFNDVICKYAQENGGRRLTEQECRLYESKKMLPTDIKEPIYVFYHHSHHNPLKNAYNCKIYFNETDVETALEKMYAFWKEYGMAYWNEYFGTPSSAVETINRSLGNIDHSLAQFDWPKKV
jgi:hypothetical protein